MRFLSLMKIFSVSALLMICLLAKSTFAQQNKAFVNGDQKTIKLFFEKTYVQTDRIYYTGGEDVWFSAFLVNGKSSSLTSTSNNLYVELIHPNSTIVDTKMIRLQEGLGKGDFKLKDTLQSGWYKLRAYTNWMRNFGDDFVFQKKIYITNTLKNSEKRQENRINPKKTISFFPEGGNLVEDVTSVVAFKTNDEFGNGLASTASVISSRGDTVTTFQSTDVGMGIFTFMPSVNEKYKVEGSYGNEKFSVALPNALKKGLALRLTTDSANIKVTIQTNALSYTELQGKPMAIVIKHSGDNIYTGTLNLSKPTLSISIPTKDFPTGLAVLTLIDHLGRPNCERLVYIPLANKIKLSITPNKTSYQQREKVNLDVRATDQFGAPAKTTFSLAVVDGLITADPITIVSYLTLQSELKGEIKNADQYFDPQNPRRFKQLDLLLLTQGWRAYVWRKLADSNLSVSYMPEPGITIKGTVREKVGNKPMPNMNITLSGPDFIGNKIYITKTDVAGNYFLDGLNWYGNQAVKMSSQDGQAKKGGWLQIDTVFKPIPVKIEKTSPVKIPTNVEVEITKRSAYNRTYKRGDSILLDAVTITGATNTLDLFDNRLTSFGYKDQVYTITAADYSYKGLEHFLLSKAEGAMPIDDGDSTGNEGVAFISRGKKVRPTLLINNKEDIQDRVDYYSLAMDQINQVVIKHMINREGMDQYVISLNVKDSALRGPNLNLLNVNLNGYYAARTFYAPNYQTNNSAIKDLRTTIFWIPLVKTDDQGLAKVSYFNGDNTGEMVVKINGITINGTAVSTKSTYKVQ